LNVDRAANESVVAWSCLRRSPPLECAQAADASALDTLWLNDHVALPAAAAAQADSDFATGIQVDILSTLAFLAGATERIGLGTAVLLLPYRPAFLTAKSVASIQALAGERLCVGVGTGWMPAEFNLFVLPIYYSRYCKHPVSASKSRRAAVCSF
jgi:alkanesulfonate monooxygenase SsuD/methylene tetrahydromethanopterin reductase-like flavin-dependent oxidoreductase (luciferase family)